MDIYVGNINFNLQEGEIQKLFEVFGQVSKVTLLREKGSQISTGKAFVVMPNAIEAQRAIDEFHGRSIAGRDLIVAQAVSSPEKEQKEKDSQTMDPREEVDKLISVLKTRKEEISAEKIIGEIETTSYSKSETEDGFIKIKFSE